MAEQILLSSVSFDGVREKGGFGQPLHALYPQIRAVLASELGSDTADLLAEPVVDRVRNRIDWYTEGDPDQPLVALSDLPEEQRQPLLTRVHDLLARGQEMAERYTASGDPQRMQLGAMLKAVLGPPAETEVFLVSGRPVVAHWGFSPDRPWVTSEVPVRGALASPPFSEPPDKMAIPDIPIPEEVVVTPQLATASESPSEPSTASSESPPALPPELPPEQPLKEPAKPVTLTQSMPPQSEPKWLPESEAPPPLPKIDPSQVVNHSDTALRYVVVGSWYFWSVAALALLLALGAAFWSRTRSSAPALTSEAAPQSPEAALDRALTDARQAEQALRLQLEQRLVALAEQRGRCPLPVGMNPASVPSTLATPPTLSTPSVPSVPSIASDPSAGFTLPPSDSTMGTSEPIVAGSALAPPIQPEVRDAAESEASPPVADSRLSPMIAIPESAAPMTGEPLIRALEGELSGSQPGVVAPPLAESASEPPVQTEPTSEERQEFASRLSAAGAATGEITATLLWDGNADLDLVVRCPSGQTLDYLSPKGCGGTLDVDANAARDSLSGKPVENIFWPAGQATPGAYKIAVRYEPRKDERNPQPVPFQIRLIRDSQEKVFKGTIRPRKTLQIANFTVVER